METRRTKLIGQKVSIFSRHIAKASCAKSSNAYKDFMGTLKGLLSREIERKQETTKQQPFSTANSNNAALIPCSLFRPNQHTMSSYQSPVSSSKQPLLLAYEEKESAQNSQNAKQRAIYSELLHQTNLYSDSNNPNNSATPIKPIQPSTQRQPLISSFRGSRLRGSELPLLPNSAAASSQPALQSNRYKPSKLEPKVLVAYDTKAGQPPRRIEIERKKRLFASQDIDLLLRAGGINYAKYATDIDHSTGNNCYLPLEMFDSQDYEIRAPQEWIEAGRAEGEANNNPSFSSCRVPCRALRFESDANTGRLSQGKYLPGAVIGYDEQSESFSVLYHDTENSVTQLPRIHIYFESESPFDYTTRVINAHKQRKLLESSIRYSLYIDSMPTDEIAPLDNEQINRILLLALNTKRLKQNALDTTNLLNEVNKDYARTMNKIIFDTNLKQNQGQTELKQQLSALESSNSRSSSRYSGVVSVASHDFARHFSDFCFHSFFTRIEAISALIKINAECLKVRNLQLFNLNFNKAVRLEEFEQLQSQQINQLSQFLREKWLLNLKNSVKSSLRDVSKGWLNLAEKNREVYIYSKLKKFMQMIQFHMQDSLRFCVLHSVANYRKFFLHQTQYKLTIHGLNNVEIVPISTDNNPNSATEPSSSSLPAFSLFSADLILRDGQIQYSVPPEQFLSTILFLFDRGLTSLFDLPNLESLVLEQLFWFNAENKLAAVQREENIIQEQYNAVESSLRAALQPLYDYVGQFSKFSAFIQLNVDDYIKTIAAKEANLAKESKETSKNTADSNDSSEKSQKNSAFAQFIDEIKKELNSQLALRGVIEQEIPKSINLGLISVNCDDVRRKFSTKCNDLIGKLLDYLAKLVRGRCEEINKNFKKLEAELKKSPQDIAELVKLKEFCGSAGQLVAGQRANISDTLIYFDLLESYSYRLPKDLFKLRWQLFSWPKTVAEQLHSKELHLQQDKLNFLATMRSEQEEFSAELLELEKRVNTFGSFIDIEKVEKIREKVDQIHSKLDELTAKARIFNGNELLFNLPSTDYRHVQKITKNFEPYYQLWSTTSDWVKNVESWRNDSFLELNGDQISTLVGTYHKTMAKCSKSKAIKENPGLASVANNIRNQIEQFKPLLPLIIALRNPGMRERHWELLSSKLPFRFQPDESTTLTKVLEEFKLQNHLEIISKVGESAGKEYQIESALQKMEDSWRGMEFDIQAYKKTGSYVVRAVDDIISLLDEHIVTTQQMQFSPYKKVFEDRIQRWANKLNLVSEVIEEWLQVQRQWLSLQSIFQSADINKQLPAEGKRFASVNKTWRLIMSQVQANPDVLSFADNPGLLQKLQDSNKLLQMVQKRLSDYLDKKRAAFARFYFLANEELLQILSQTQDPLAVQPHLKKCFENINKLHFSSEKTDEAVITAMYSAEEEKIEFVRPINPAKKAVEYWLGEVEQAMKDSVQYQLNRAIADYNQCSRAEWVQKWPGQCVLNGSQVHWTQQVESALQASGNKGIVSYLAQWEQQLIEMVSLVRGNLSFIQQQIMGALIVLDVHARDVIERLVREKVENINDFAWIMQMRYYLEPSQSSSHEQNDKLFVQMVQSRFPYGYEYLGNTLRLVITPLTDRCYMTLMTALQLHLGGSPAGPAGTGKTETVKDLAKSLAKQCVVFNCSDGLNFLAMGKFFKGLASAGAWSCFDEFNRIDVEVLSVVAQQIMTIWNAVREGVRTFVFEETEIKLDPTCGVFITMNPGYAGRTELPDNLQALFRPVAMMVPDYALIAQIMLYSFGFNKAVSLARKMVATFQLSSEQLSSQDHYDYGMRSVKSTITRAGILKREEPNTDEDELLLRALSDVNVPKFLKQDIPLFEGIIKDLFPTTAKPNLDYSLINQSLTEACAEANLQPVDSFLQKAIQLYETIVVRHGVMLVGPTGGAKTSSLRMLAAAMGRLAHLELPQYSKVKVHALNPKAITMGQLYGELDKHSGEWTDGILAQIVRDCIEDSSSTRKWIVFDGPVDALWIESMNTVLDDNKKLCLVSGEILQLTAQMSMIFEVEDLSVASPATVSRCGMVYMEPQALGLSVLIKSWLNSLHTVFTDLKPKFQQLFDSLLDPCIEFIRRHCTEPVPTVDNNLAKSLLNLLQAQQAPFIPVEGLNRSEELDIAMNNYFSHVETQFLLALVWSVGATVDKAGRSKFSDFLRSLIKAQNLKDFQNLPENGVIYDYCYDFSSNSWVNWAATAAEYKFDDRLSYSELIIPTTDSIRNTFWLDLLVQNKKQVLLTGHTGTGKTVTVNSYLSSLPADQLAPINIIFNAATTANQLEDLLFGKMVKRRQRVWGPALGKRFVIFLDDLNMPAREQYGAQPPIELLRQWMDYNGWFDRRSLTFTEIVDISFIAAQGPAGGGRNPITPRFLRHFNQIHQTELEFSSLQAIFTVIVANSLDKFVEEIKTLSSKLVEATIGVYSTISSSLLPTPNKSHYTFNLRDLSAVFQGILSSSSRRIVSSATFLRLWVHENCRVFRDRLVDLNDRNWLDRLLQSKLKEEFRVEWVDIKPTNNGVLLFGDYLEGLGAEQRFYDEVKDLSSVVRVMEDSLSEYNDENSPMKLTMFSDAVEHTSRICRILRQPGGNALLLGVGGSGRQSLTRLACYMSEYELFQVEVGKNYGVAEWHADLRKLLLDCGLKEQPTVFLLTDSQMTNPAFYNDLNNILNSGEVPNLYSNEDLDNIQATCKIDCQRKNLAPTKLNTYQQFITRVKQNLHVVFCMSPGSDVFRTRLRLFPALVNCCTIDWFSDWPDEALSSVANTSLTETEELKLNNVPAIVETMKLIHNSVTVKSLLFKQELRRYNYVTPTSYLELLNIFKFLFNEKKAEIGGLRTKLQYGLDTLQSASNDIANLQLDLQQKQPRLVETQREVELTLQQISADRKDADATKEVVEKQEADAALKAAECKEIKDSAQQELDQALPMLDAAVECLRELNKSHIDEVRNFKKPPPAVILTMEAACIMLRQKLKLKVVMKQQEGNSMIKVPDYWATATKYLLKQPKLLLQTLQNYDRDNIPEAVISKIKPYILREDFSVKRVETASVACRAICMWVHAMYNYYHVAILVEPKRVKLRAAESEYNEVQSALNDAKARMKQVEERLRQLQDKYEALLAESDSLTKGVELCRIKLDRANKLISGLGGEKERWISTVQQLNGNFDNITGDVLISSATIAYLGAFTASYRASLLDSWRASLRTGEISFTEGGSVRSILGDAVQIRAWNIAGLPTDSVSIENGIIMSKARRWPLMIDPQSQAAKFIKKLGAQKFESGMEIVKLSDKNFLHAFENAVRFGRWILLENVGEELDAALEPLLLQQIINIKGVPHIKLGENTIPYNDQFHLYITSKLPNPHFPPELQVKVTLLNFTLTPEGLQDQMLGTVVAKESPELEQKKNALVVQSARMKKQLQDTEDLILRMLSEVKGDILEDEELINTLGASKRTSEEIAERVVEAESVEKDIDSSRTAYAPVAQRAQILYFCIAELSLIDPMYQYSLQWFVQIFISAILAAPQSLTNDMAERLSNLNSFFTRLLYENVCRSLFEQHKLLFSFLLTVKINEAKGLVNPAEWRFLIAGGRSTNDQSSALSPTSNKLFNPAPAWLVENNWDQIVSLGQLPSFSGFESDFAHNVAQYKAIFDSVEPQTAPISPNFSEKLDQFQNLLVLKCIRPDKMQGAIQNYVRANLGAEFTESPQFSLNSSYKDSSCLTPLIFILSRGADPAAKIFNFAAEMGYREKIVSISLGQGQGMIAERAIEEAAKRGSWVLLQNCHLAMSWLPNLERIVTEMKGEETHEEFRLFLTSMPTAQFPVAILQNGIKITNEPPKGLKANLMRSYLSFTENQLNKSKKPKEFKKLLFSLCLFHAVVLDRKKFGALGWNIPYQFTENDLSVSITQLRDFIDMYDQIPYDVIHFLIHDINYGGRITDYNDQKVIRTILDDFINPAVLGDDYSFSSSGKYLSLPTGTKDYYLKAIASMEAEPEPEMFGMHANADIQAAQNETNQLFETILTLLPRTASSTGTSREQIIQATSQAILDQLPGNFNSEEILSKFPTNYAESMNTVLQQESIRYNKLLSVIRTSLNDLNRALRGEMVMTESLETMGAALYNNIVPTFWANHAYPSLMSLSSWISDLLQRLNFINHWVNHGIPNVFWISGFFFPQAFLTGTLQNFARKQQKPIDQIQFSFQVMHTNRPEEVSSKPVEGIYISGLYLQGCRWDLAQSSLVDSNPKELFTLFPLIHLKPNEINPNSTGAAANEATYRCPVYKTLTRAGVLSTTGHSTNFVMYIDIPTRVKPEKWTKAGVALFCALRY
jgi:dynein heavy chain